MASINLAVEFFKEDFLQAIGAGIYEIGVRKSGKSVPLYIGESTFVLVRCAAHLYHLRKEPALFGFEEDTINDPSITLSFHLLKSEEDKQARKKRETELVKERHPISQSGRRDSQKPIEEKIEALRQFLQSC